MSLKLILAIDKEFNIGYNNKLLYWIKEDLEYFKEVTIGKKVVMGSNTWESLPSKLSNRENCLLTSNWLYMMGRQYRPNERKPDIIYGNIEEVIKDSKKEEVWIIGGKSLYEQFLPYCDEVHLTIIDDISDKSDTKISNLFDMLIDNNFKEDSVSNLFGYDRKSKRYLDYKLVKYGKI